MTLSKFFHSPFTKSVDLKNKLAISSASLVENFLTLALLNNRSSLLSYGEISNLSKLLFMFSLI